MPVRRILCRCLHTLWALTIVSCTSTGLRQDLGPVAFSFGHFGFESVPTGPGQVFGAEKIRSYPQARRGLLLNDGTVILFFETTRPATDSEKAKRLAEFERKWKLLAQKNGSAHPLEKAERGLRQQVPGSPYLPLHSFSAILTDFFSGIGRMSKRIAYPLARNYLVRQPTVVRAGFVFDFPGGKGKEILLDLKEQYGPEPWQRIPTGAAVMRASPDGRFLALNSEWGGILHYRISPEGAVTPLGRIDGRHPFGFSPDGRYLFVSVAKGLYRIFTLPSESDPGFRRVPSPFRAIKDVRLPIRQNHQVTNVKLVDDHLLVLTWHDFFIHDVARNRLRRHFRWGGRSLLITPSRNALVAKMDRSTLVSVDLKTMAIRERSNDYFTLIRRHRVYFDNLISLHPQERYLAALYDPGLIPPGKESLGESRLFVWDLERRQVVWRLRQRLEDPAGGFGYQPPATFTRDWRYFLIAGKDDGLELWRLSKRR